MIELFSVFIKGGLGLWTFQEGTNCFVDAINAFIRDVLIQGRAVMEFKFNEMTIRFKLDNEFELVLVVIYQSALQLSYTDKLLSDVHRKFRDMYKNVLLNKQILYQNAKGTFWSFDSEFMRIRNELLKLDENSVSVRRKPRSFQESAKSQKAIGSIKVRRPGEEKKVKKAERHLAKVSMEGTIVTVKADMKKKGKQARVWELSGNVENLTNLDYSADKDKVCRLLRSLNNIFSFSPVICVLGVRNLG
ncbi:hypothetical protein KIN20_011706 [Parelaphostrongylus tenuis]|uniref:Signal recognition particle receptor alpha subunit N-terminal domain-containing protein n=1 Tax=Parelaphostrongylus tenuis TaxID=148309 RepID=A0AAD5M9V6_PARTN|nr:hypothetical protein KIN20_011706 [Parelaphostrongylus tenuis]